ncbi:DUF86 domain-containing protein [Tunicatimonas pelagia]|nr:HepT-like ribonuclease domain-containing protein [Tunicatimonas pelagia]WKN46395.1 DUF86 domain-containing protein [Tunicatimonas pelagia]
MPWQQIANFRNRLAHDYRGIDPDITFDIIINYLPDLKQALGVMLSHIDYDPQVLELSIKSEYYKHLQYLLSS